MTTFVAMVQIETDDPRVTFDQLTKQQDAAGTAARRAAVLEQLPHKVTRLIALLPVAHARALMHLHEAVGDELGAPKFSRPPADYEPPAGH